MSAMAVSLSDDLRSFAEERAAAGGYGTTEDYVLDLIRRDQDRLRLRERLLAGGGSRETGPVDTDYFAGLRQRARNSATV